MRELYQDSMAAVRAFGKPDLFITFTCNPTWKEIAGELLPQQSAQSRPDLTARVFRAKLATLLRDLDRDQVFGKTLARLYVVEFQKRGLPHAHILLILAPEDKPRSADDYDEIVCAQLPDPQLAPRLWTTIVTSMIHGPCGALNPSSPCMQDGQCSKGYPKDFQFATVEKQGYPLYARPQNGRAAEKKGVRLDNRWVVPYNKWLCRKYDAHINVEICTTVSAVKYLYTYVYKGPDRALIELNAEAPVDEIRAYLGGRYFTAQEACWRILQFDLHGHFPHVQRLHVHLEDDQIVHFHDDDALREAANRPRRETTLTSWFHANAEYPEIARDTRYHDLPWRFVWDVSSRHWRPRVRGHGDTIGRMNSATPREGERFCLRLLLPTVTGATSYEALRTLPGGSVCPTFRAAATARGLLRDDAEYRGAFQEAASSASAASLRHFFATLLLYCAPQNPGTLWAEFLPYLAEDVRRDHGRGALDPALLLNEQTVGETLCRLDDVLRRLGSSVAEFPGLPPLPTERPGAQTREVREIADEMAYDFAALREETAKRVPDLNPEQVSAYDSIMRDVGRQLPSVHFIDGPGGTGKTYLYNTLLSATRLGYEAATSRVALAAASSGIAALLLKGGRTARSRFRLPTKVDENSTCAIERGSGLARLLREASLIVWDEAPMAHCHLFECLDRTLQDICRNSAPFGGKVVVVGGDFRQLLPVVRHGSRAQVANAALPKSHLWRLVRRHRLTQNMRVREGEGAFAEYLLRIGEGREPVVAGDDTIQLPGDICNPIMDRDASTQGMVARAFPDLASRATDAQFLSSRAVLAARNSDVDELNDAAASAFPGEIQDFRGADCVPDDESTDNYRVEFLSTLNISGLPPHELRLKLGMPVMLLRNLNPPFGL